MSKKSLKKSGGKVGDVAKKVGKAALFGVAGLAAEKAIKNKLDKSGAGKAVKMKLGKAGAGKKCGGGKKKGKGAGTDYAKVADKRQLENYETVARQQAGQAPAQAKTGAKKDVAGWTSYKDFKGAGKKKTKKSK